MLLIKSKFEQLIHKTKQFTWLSNCLTAIGAMGLLFLGYDILAFAYNWPILSAALIVGVILFTIGYFCIERLIDLLELDR